MALGIAIDKSQLLRNRPTAVTNSSVTSTIYEGGGPSARIAAVDEAFRRVAIRASGGNPDAPE